MHGRVQAAVRSVCYSSVPGHGEGSSEPAALAVRPALAWLQRCPRWAPVRVGCSSAARESSRRRFCRYSKACVLGWSCGPWRCRCADGTRRETQDVRARTATTRMGRSGAPIRSLVSLDTAPLRCETLWVRLIGADRVGFGVSRSRSCCSSVAETSSTRRTEQLRVQYL